MNGDKRTKTGLDAPGWEVDYRISQCTQPIHYDVYLFPDLEADTFSGKVAIDIQVTGPPRSFLAVHIKHLNITKVSLSITAVLVIFHNTHNEFITKELIVENAIYFRLFNLIILYRQA